MALDFLTCHPTFMSLAEELIVARLGVADMSADRQTHSLGVQFLGSRAPAHPVAVLAAGVLGDVPLAAWRAGRVQLSDGRGKKRNILLVFLPAAFGVTLPAALPYFGVGQAFLLGLG
jgi:hypothetical protein